MTRKAATTPRPKRDQRKPTVILRERIVELQREIAGVEAMIEHEEILSRKRSGVDEHY